MKKYVTFLLIFVFASNAWSLEILGTGSSAAELMPLISETNYLLAEIYGEEFKTNNTQLVKMISQGADTIDRINKVVDTGRKMYQLYESIVNYDQLLTTSKKGFCDGISKGGDSNLCDRLEQGFVEMRDNVEMISDGDARFFTYSSKWDSNTDRFLDYMVKDSMKAYIFPVIAPNVSKMHGYGGEINEAEKIFKAALVRSGLEKSIKFENEQATQMNYAFNDFVNAAQKSGNVVAQGQVIQTAYAQQQARDLNDIKNIEKARLLHEETARDLQKTNIQVFHKQYLKSSKDSYKELVEMFK